MFRILNCLAVEHDWRLVLLAALVCFLASVTAINLFRCAQSTTGRGRAAWIVTAGAATGCGIWATHFIAMLAYEPGVPTGYDIGLTALSLVVAIGITCIGLSVPAYRPNRWSAPAGGAILGGGIACMHYLGMWALEVPGWVTWQWHLVTASVELTEKPLLADVVNAIQQFRGAPQERKLPSAPCRPLIYMAEQDRPQPRRDAPRENGMSVFVGRLRPCPVLDYKFAACGHNTIRGAAGAAVLNAELMVSEGLID